MADLQVTPGMTAARPDPGTRGGSGMHGCPPSTFLFPVPGPDAVLFPGCVGHLRGFPAAATTLLGEVRGGGLWEPLGVSGFLVLGPTVIRWCWVFLGLGVLAFLGCKSGATLSSGGHLGPGHWVSTEAVVGRAEGCAGASRACPSF